MLGSGQRLFTHSPHRLRLALAEHSAYSNGVVRLHYSPPRNGISGQAGTAQAAAVVDLRA